MIIHNASYPHFALPHHAEDLLPLLSFCLDFAIFHGTIRAWLALPVISPLRAQGVLQRPTPALAISRLPYSRLQGCSADRWARMEVHSIHRHWCIGKTALARLQSPRRMRIDGGDVRNHDQRDQKEYKGVKMHLRGGMGR